MQVRNGAGVRAKARVRAAQTRVGGTGAGEGAQMRVVQTQVREEWVRGHRHG